MNKGSDWPFTTTSNQPKFTLPHLAMLKEKKKKKDTRTFTKGGYAGLNGREVTTDVRSRNDVLTFIRSVQNARALASKSTLRFG